MHRSDSCQLLRHAVDLTSCMASVIQQLHGMHRPACSSMLTSVIQQLHGVHRPAGLQDHDRAVGCCCVPQTHQTILASADGHAVQQKGAADGT